MHALLCESSLLFTIILLSHALVLSKQDKPGARITWRSFLNPLIHVSSLIFNQIWLILFHLGKEDILTIMNNVRLFMTIIIQGLLVLQKTESLSTKLIACHVKRDTLSNFEVNLRE
jgi:hypothetical protein